MSNDLRSRTIRLAHSNPVLRPHLLPLLREAAESPEAGFYQRGDAYIYVADVDKDGYVAGIGTHTKGSPDQDGEGPQSADLSIMKSDLKAWKKVPVAKIPANWKAWFKKENLGHFPALAKL